MLNKIWIFMMTASLLYSFAAGTYAETVQAGISSCGDTLNLLLIMLGILCFFNGLLKIAEECGVTRMVAKILSPVLLKLFPDLPKSSEALGAITMNITANLLGLGNAATPLGLSAMEKMQAYQQTPGKATHAMCLFVVMNTASIQLIPSTILSLRMTYGSQNPYIILFPVWISSFLGLLAGILAAKWFRLREERVISCR